MNQNYSPQIDPLSLRRTQELNDIIGQKRAVHEEELHKHSLAVVANVHTTLEEAAQAAAIADGVAALTAKADANCKSKKVGLRRGKWTGEEEAYANRLIQEFKRGLLPLTDGTTLRTFLSKLLNCDPMRISKKFVGQNCIGKQVFRRRQSDLDKLTPEQIDKSRRELAELERRFLERVAQTNRSKGGSERAPTPKDSKPSIPSIAEPRNTHIMAQPMYPPTHAHTPLAPWMIPPQQLSAQPLQQHTHMPYNMSMQSPQPPVYSGHPHAQAPMSDQSTSSASPRTPAQAHESQTSPHSYAHTQSEDLQPPRVTRRKTDSDVIVPPSHTVTVSHIHTNTHANTSKQMGEPTHTYSHTSSAQHFRKPMTTFPRTPSMELLQSLNLPTVGSLENLASFGMTSFPSSGNLSGFQSSHGPSRSSMNMMTWEQNTQQVMDHEHTHTAYPNPHPNPNIKKHSLNQEDPYPPIKKQMLSEAALSEDSHTQRQVNVQTNSSQFPTPGPFNRHVKREPGHVPTHAQIQTFDIPRNTSVDDFLALIANGDIPPLTNECLSTNSHIRHQTDFPSPTSSPSPPNTHTNAPNTNTPNTHTNFGTGRADMASEDHVHKQLTHTHIHANTHTQVKGQRGDHVEV